MRLPHAATSGLLPTARYRRPTWTRSSRRAAAPRRHKTGRPGAFSSAPIRGKRRGVPPGGPALPLARELLGFPQDRDWALLISLGYPADRSLVPIRNPSRRPFGEVVHRGRW